MHLIRHARRLPLSSSQRSTLIASQYTVAEPQHDRHRGYSTEATLTAEKVSPTEEFVVTEGSSEAPNSSPAQSNPPILSPRLEPTIQQAARELAALKYHNATGGKKASLADKLRVREKELAAKPPSEKKKKKKKSKSEVVEAAGHSILRDQHGQASVLHTLAQAFSAEKNDIGGAISKKKQRREKKKSAKVDASAMFEHFRQRPTGKSSDPSSGGWNSRPLGEDNWGEDSRS